MVHCWTKHISCCPLTSDRPNQPVRRSPLAGAFPCSAALSAACCSADRHPAARAHHCQASASPGVELPELSRERTRKQYIGGNTRMSLSTPGKEPEQYDGANSRAPRSTPKPDNMKLRNDTMSPTLLMINWGHTGLDQSVRGCEQCRVSAAVNS